MKKFCLVLSLVTIFSAAVFAQSSEERKVLDEINLARTAPKEYVKKVLEPLVDGTLGSYQSAVVECISLMRTMNPVPALSWSSGLYKSAKEKTLGENERNAADYDSRISKYVSWKSCGEMTVYGYSDARGVVLSLLLDMESDKRSHRRVIFSDRFSHLGAAIRENGTYKNDCVLDFASGCISYDDLPDSLYHEDEVRQLISEINLARTKPLDYISTRLGVLAKDGGSMKKDVAALITYLKNFTPVPELEYSKELCGSAEKFVRGSNYSGSGKLSQSTTWERNIRSLRNWGAVAEAFTVGESDPRAAVIRMLSDSTSGNRDNLLSASLNYAGGFIGENSVVCVDMASWHVLENTPANGILASDAASDMIYEINWARTKPREYAKVRLEPLVKNEANDFQKALSDLIREMEKGKSVPALKIMAGLNDAASEWVLAQGKTASTTYDSKWQTRIARYGILNGGGEVLYFGDEIPELAVARMLVDEKFPAKNQRKALLSSAYSYIGAATSVHGVYTGMALVELASDFVPKNDSVLESGISSYGNGVTLAESGVVDEINFARAHPQEYVSTRLAALVSSEKNSFQTALGELISEMNSMAPLPEIDFSIGLHDACAEFADSAAKKGRTVSDTFWLERVDRFCEWDRAAELISLGCYTPEDIVMQLLIDDQIAGRGHRRILLNGELDAAGVAIGRHSKTGTICVIDLIKTAR